MFKKDIWRYGAVTVKTQQGELWQGLVVDVNGKHGLTVNFGCPQFQALLVPWANFVQGRNWTPASRLTYGGPALVLYQLAADAPWSWHRARFLAGGPDYAYAFVELRLLNGTLVREVMAWERVQPLAVMLPCEWDKAPHKAPFKKCCIELTGDPQLLAVTQRPDFVEQWFRMTDTLAVGVQGRNLTCLATSKEIPRLIALESGALPLSRIGRIELKAGWRRPRQDCMDAASNVASLPGAANVDPVSATDSHRLSNMQHLPVELWTRVFSFLNAYERVKASETCYTWNRLLKSPPLAARVEIDMTQCSGELVACMVHKLVTSSTKTLVVVSSDDQRWMLSHPLLHSPLHIVADMIDILRAKNLRVPRIVLARCRIRKYSLLGWTDRRADLARRWRNVCDQLLVKDMHLLLTFRDRMDLQLADESLQYWRDPERVVFYRIKSKTIDTRTKNQLTVLDVLESALQYEVVSL